jgi:hypothetical protein
MFTFRFGIKTLTKLKTVQKYKKKSARGTIENTRRTQYIPDMTL